LLGRSSHGKRRGPNRSRPCYQTYHARYHFLQSFRKRFPSSRPVITFPFISSTRRPTFAPCADFLWSTLSYNGKKKLKNIKGLHKILSPAWALASLPLVDMAFSTSTPLAPRSTWFLGLSSSLMYMQPEGQFHSHSSKNDAQTLPFIYFSLSISDTLGAFWGS